jgi:hypothetical protein
MPDKLYCFCGWPLTVKCLDVVQPKLLSFYRGGNVCRANSGWCRGLCRTIDLRGSGAKFKFNEEQRLFLLHTSASYPHAIFTILEVHDSHSRMSIGVNYENENEISIWQTAESNLFTKSNRVSLGHFGARRMIGNPWKILDLSLYEWNSVPNGCYSNRKMKIKSRFRKLAEDD